MGSDQPRPAKDESGDILRIVAELIEAYSADDAERMRATLHSGFVYEEMGTQRETEGRQDFLDIWANWRQVFPDNQGTIEMNRTGFLGDLIAWEDGVYGTSKSVFSGGA